LAVPRVPTGSIAPRFATPLGPPCRSTDGTAADPRCASSSPTHCPHIAHPYTSTLVTPVARPCLKMNIPSRRFLGAEWQTSPCRPCRCRTLPDTLALSSTPAYPLSPTRFTHSTTLFILVYSLHSTLTLTTPSLTRTRSHSLAPTRTLSHSHSLYPSRSLTLSHHLALSHSPHALCPQSPCPLTPSRSSRSAHSLTLSHSPHSPCPHSSLFTPSHASLPHTLCTHSHALMLSLTLSHSRHSLSPAFTGGDRRRRLPVSLRREDALRADILPAPSAPPTTAAR
jgi:hypothetical protein